MNVNTRYIILDVSELSKVDFTEVLETSDQTVRFSVDELKCIVHWDSLTPPSFVSSLNYYDGPYTHAELTVELNTPNWELKLPR